MIIIVSGSRGWTDKERIRNRLLHYEPDVVVQGYCSEGADELCREVCEEEGIECLDRPAQWRKEGKYRWWAGFERNAAMLDEFPDAMLLAFWDGQSKGTSNCINSAAARGMSVEVQL